MEKEISQAVIRRMPRYYRFLRDLLESGVERVSSSELSKLMNVTASQIRQDLNNFGGFGQQGYGYNVRFLYEEIGKILGLNEIHQMIIIGAGNLGQAIANYGRFDRLGFITIALFDVNPNLIGKKVRGIQIYALDDTWLGLFAGSGRMMQSRYIKVGEYYRIYTAISCRATNWNGSVNHVLYSDDFGENWHILGNTTMATAPVAPGDEPKVEELPNGDVVIAARKNYGRYINIFSYDKNDSTYTKGSWSTQADLGLRNCGGCDGETYFVYAKKKDTEEYVYLALQSIPTINGRYGVGIFYKELGASDTTPQAYISGWGTDKFFMVQEMKKLILKLSLFQLLLL